MSPISNKGYQSVEHLRSDATKLAGALGDLSQRAAVYHHLYEHSRGNHVFPLLAAHGALWAKGYFQWGIRIGNLASLRFPEPMRKEKRSQLQNFANAFRDINRRVCIETFTIFYLTKQPSLLAQAEHHMPPRLIELMLACHAAENADRQLCAHDKRALFGEFFLWEQHNIVGPAVTAAVKAFDWGFMRDLAMRPSVRFAYLPRLEPLRFANFADISERIDKGFRAYDIGERCGWNEVDQAICKYGIMPNDFIQDSAAHVSRIFQRLSVPAYNLQS